MAPKVRNPRGEGLTVIDLVIGNLQPTKLRVSVNMVVVSNDGNLVGF